MADEELWKRRFHLFMAARLIGLLLFIAGVAVAFSDLVREGGWPQLGGLIAVLGALEAVIVPRMLKRQWDRQ